MTIVVKCTITVYFLICSLSKNRFPLLSFQIGMKLSSLCSLHTMIWPQSLWFSMHLNLFKVGFSIMVGSKAYMVLRMPILSGNHEIKFMLYRSEERRVGKSVDLGGRRVIKRKKRKEVRGDVVARWRSKV